MSLIKCITTKVAGQWQKRCPTSCKLEHYQKFKFSGMLCHSNY